MSDGSLTGVLTNPGSAVRPDDKFVPKSAQDAYKITIDVRGDDLIRQIRGRDVFPIHANMPQKFQLALSSQWDTPFSAASASDVGGALAGQLGQLAVDATAASAGVSTRAYSQTIRAWQGSSAGAINLDLIFYAQENTDLEIRQRHLALLRLQAPSRTGPGGQVLRSPGPYILSGSDQVEGRQITVYLGKYIKMENVVITSVSSDIIALFDEQGLPIGTSISIQIETFNACLTAENLEQMFYPGGV